MCVVYRLQEEVEGGRDWRGEDRPRVSSPLLSSTLAPWRVIFHDMIESARTSLQSGIIRKVS